MGWIGFLLTSAACLLVVGIAWFFIDLAGAFTPDNPVAQDTVESTSEGLSLFRSDIDLGDLWYIAAAFAVMLVFAGGYRLFMIGKEQDDEAG